MKDLIIDTLICTELNSAGRQVSFEIFGYDFLIDEDFWTWLIEVNTNPYFGVPNDFIWKLLPEMVHEMLQIVVDPIYQPSKSFNFSNFELIYSPEVNQRRPFSASLYPIADKA